MDYVNAFWVGGASAHWCRSYWTRQKLLPGRVMVLLVCSGAVLGLSESMNHFQICRSGGFGTAAWIWKYTVERNETAIDESGFLGLFTGGFTACAVGVSAALIFGYLASLIFKSKCGNNEKQTSRC